ncbi:hypothetical protein F2P44_05145 [Massilia sp. CCM 8695]|uniref:Uncharacterized protein n=1 Tax=Massilia frigida TaxID=2609281 RepID=A0ABX0N0A5_9BURK|nr:hypothetical protein [Massilia frigida]NHZ78669.1 hypothetical protein [Massilia frigida]
MAIATKKQASGSATESGGPGLGGNWIDKIEQVGDLGKGYMLLKLTTPRKGATYSSGPHALAETGAATTMPPSVKRFTPGQLEKLIKSFSADLGIAPTVGVVRASPPAPKGNRTPGENDQFMYDLRAQEVANRTRDFDEGLPRCWPYGCK